MPECNILKYPQSLYKKGVGDQTYKLGKMAGIKFIELRHAYEISLERHPIKVHGFQGVEIFYNAGNRRAGGVGKYSAKYTMDMQGEDTKTTQGLEFVPEELTDILQGFCPDTPYNRNFIATMHLSEKKPFYVVEPDIAEEIKAIAIEKGYNKFKTVKPDEVIETQQQTIDELMAENALLKKKDLDRAKANEAIKVSKGDDLKKVARDEVLKEEDPWIQKQGTKMVENGKDPKHIYVSKPYKDYILPKIQKRIEEKELELQK